MEDLSFKPLARPVCRNLAAFLLRSAFEEAGAIHLLSGPLSLRPRIIWFSRVVDGRGVCRFPLSTHCILHAPYPHTRSARARKDLMAASPDVRPPDDDIILVDFVTIGSVILPSQPGFGMPQSKGRYKNLSKSIAYSSIGHPVAPHTEV